ncbi:hypothetical protein AQF98_09875 [Pedobacter sp. Hv1]|nr:hypothetical protein AQF98_09875 [Pedobacter sp. Hv1]
MAQNTISGKVLNAQKTPLEAVNIKIVETNQLAVSNKLGQFNFEINNNNELLTLEFSYIGFQKLTRIVNLKDAKIDLGTITLKELNLSLETIEINAKRNYEGSSNSSLIIGRDIIEQIPALSINDLLNQIPNRKIMPPSLQSVQNISLRGAYNSNVFDLNNSFGVAIIIDGNAISNNANMQGYNPGNRGFGSTKVTLGSGDYGLTNANKVGYNGDYTFGGTDLRQIPADNIESIEVIAGVPSVKYGDLTDGAIIVERQAGKSPAYVRMQLRDNATSYGYSQGFRLSPELGSFNVGLNYVNSFADNRDKMKAYKRLNLNAMWTNTFGKEKRLKNTFSFDYGRNLDGIKKDPDDPYGRFIDFTSWNLSFSNRTSYRFNHPFFKNISFNARYSQSHQSTYTEQYQNYAYILYTNAITTGFTDGIYDTGIYTSVSHIDGRPITLSGQVELNTYFKTGEINHYLNFGTNYSYAINNGLGRIVDPSRPRPSFNTTGTTLSSGPTERYYDFSLVIPQKDFGAYAEDVFKIRLFGKDLNTRIGVRLDGQNNYFNLSPRTNINYQVSKNLRLGLAYGLAYKSPGLAHLYPGPAFFEIPLINSYNGNVKESRSIFYMYRYDPTSNLKSSNTQTIELTALYKLGNYNLSVSLFNKDLRNGINTVQEYKAIDLPVYQATFRPGQQPLIVETGTKKKLINYHYFNNSLKSKNQGIELILNTPKYEAIATSFNLSGGIFRSAYFDANNRISPLLASNTLPESPLIAFYQHNSRTTYFSSGRISSSTHIPKISLLVQFTAEFSFINKTIYEPGSGIPIGYYNNNNDYIDLPNPDPTNPLYKHLFLSTAQQNETNQFRVFTNYHMSVAKEIKKRFKFAFNVYNVFNYQPRYLNVLGTSVIKPNSSPTFGAELSIKL